MSAEKRMDRTLTEPEQVVGREAVHLALSRFIELRENYEWEHLRR